MLDAWTGAGFDPAGFWTATPGLVSLHLRARASARAEELRVQAWMTAALMRAEKMPDFEQFVSGRVNRAREVAAFEAAWDAIGRNLATNRKRANWRKA